MQRLYYLYLHSMLLERTLSLFLAILHKILDVLYPVFLETNAS